MNPLAVRQTDIYVGAENGLNARNVRIRTSKYTSFFSYITITKVFEEVPTTTINVSTMTVMGCHCQKRVASTGTVRIRKRLSMPRRRHNIKACARVNGLRLSHLLLALIARFEKVLNRETEVNYYFK